MNSDPQTQLTSNPRSLHSSMDDRKVEARLRAALMPEMSILQCQKLAEDMGYDSATFDLVGPRGTLKCQWLDAYFGMFRIEGRGDGFFMVSDFQYVPDLRCENLKVPSVESTPPKSSSVSG